MNKNNFIKGCMALAAVALMSSCEDFLDEKPQSIYTTDTFYSTERDFEYAVNAIYQAQLKVMNAPGDVNSITSRSGWHGMFRLASVRSDEKSLYRGVNFYSDGAENMTDTESGSAKDYIWQYMYIMISRSNAVLDRIDAFEFKSADTKNSLKGQALALRAWAYYQLGINFGGVPILTKEMTVDETRAIGRSSQEQTFAQAAADFKAAMGLLPAKFTGDNLGRVGKYGAEGMLARMYMYEGKTAEAKACLEDIIRNGGYALAPNYIDCFSEAGEGNSERLWELNYIPNADGYGQSITEGWMQESYQYNASNPYEPFKLACNGASSAISVSEGLLADYEAGDIRRTYYATDVKSAYSPDYTFVTKFSYYETLPNDPNMWGVNIPLVRYADVLLMYAECLGEAQGTQYLDAVRARAGLKGWKESGYTTDWTTALRHERRVELAFEGIRFYDLVRWGIAQQVMNDYFCSKWGGAKCEGEATTGTPYYKMRDGQEIYAIPQTEIDLYNNQELMWQNPAYK